MYYCAHSNKLDGQCSSLTARLLVNCQFPDRLQALLAEVKVPGQLHEVVVVVWGQRDLPAVHPHSRPDADLLQALHFFQRRALQEWRCPRYEPIVAVVHPPLTLLLLEWALVEPSESSQGVQVENGTGQGREGVASDVEGVEVTKEPDCEREARETVILQRETLEITQPPDRGVESAEVDVIQRERGEAFGFAKLERRKRQR